MNTRTQMVLTLVNSAVIILLVYIHIDIGGGDPSFGRHGGSQGLFSGGGGKRGEDLERVGQGGRDGERGQGEDQRAAGTGVEVMRVLRKLQASQVKSLIDLNVDLLSNEQATARFYKEISTPVQGVCYSLKRFGGRWFPTYQAFDGDKFVCMDGYSPKDCLVYSFGIRSEWEFEDLMDSLNCTVHAHDPTVSFPPNRGKDEHFHKLGVAVERDPKTHMETLKTLMAANGHDTKKVFYLKVDIEGAELAALPQWIESGALDKVEQVAMELHLPPIHQQKRFQWLLKVLQQLYKLGFRLISHEVNMTVKNQSATKGYHAYLETVLMRDNIWNFLDQT